ncbi:amidohydrolase family protein [bacterium]|nr:amidohydrolase family protein [bacterium]
MIPCVLPDDNLLQGQKSRPIIDFHTHFYPDRLMEAFWSWFDKHAWNIVYKKYAPELVKILNNEGLSKAVVLHYPHKINMAEDLNKWVFDFCNQHRDFLLPFGSLHPDDSHKEKILKTCFETYKFHGLKFHSHVQHVSPDDARMTEVYEVANHYKTIVLIHCGTGPCFEESNGYGYDVKTVSGVNRFEKIVGKYRDIKFVVPHLGFEEIEPFLGLVKNHPNLYFDTAMAIGKYFPNRVDPQWIADHHDRILFGTDFPIIPYAWHHERDMLVSFKLGKEIEDAIFYKNALKLLNISL